MHNDQFRLRRHRPDRRHVRARTRSVAGHGATVTDIVDTIERSRPSTSGYTSTFEGVTTTYAGSPRQGAGARSDVGIGSHVVRRQQPGHSAREPHGRGCADRRSDRGHWTRTCLRTTPTSSARRYAAHGAGSRRLQLRRRPPPTSCSSSSAPNGGFRLDFTAEQDRLRPVVHGQHLRPRPTPPRSPYSSWPPSRAPVTVAMRSTKAKAWLTRSSAATAPSVAGPAPRSPTPTALGLSAWALGDSPTSRAGGGAGCASTRQRPRTRATRSPSETGRDRLRRPRPARHGRSEWHHRRRSRTSGAVRPRRRLPASAGSPPTPPPRPIDLTGPSGLREGRRPPGS